MSEAMKKGKKKVIKSRMYFDEKGYMVNEDYSSYEEMEESPKKDEKPKKIQIDLTQAASVKAGEVGNKPAPAKA